MAYSLGDVELLSIPPVISLPNQAGTLPASSARVIAQTQAPLFQAANTAAVRQFGAGGGTLEQYKTWIYGAAGLVLVLALLRRR